MNEKHIAYTEPKVILEIKNLTKNLQLRVEKL